MEITADEKKYSKVVFACITTVFVLYAVFAEFCYFVYGNRLQLPLITSYLPENEYPVIFTKLFFCINLCFTYPLVLYPAV